LSRFFKNLKKRPVIALCFLYVASLIILSAAAPVISSYDYDTQNLEGQFSPPTVKNYFGTDIKGRDLFVRILYGAKISLIVGLLATFVSVVIGSIYGMTAGYFGGKLDNFMMRAVDVLYSLPFMFLVIILMVYLGRNFYVLFIALGMVSWLTMARIVRGQVITLKNAEFIQAARAVGTSDARIIFRHILPNLINIIIVYSSLMIPAVILEESFLSFLGLGIQPPACSLGSLASMGAETINPVNIYWWLVFFPCAVLVLLLLALNFIGDFLRDQFDPRKGNK